MRAPQAWAVYGRSSGRGIFAYQKRMNAEISEIELLGCGMQIPELLMQIDSAKNCGSYSFKICDAHNFRATIKILTEMYASHQYLSRDPKKSLPRDPKFATPTLTLQKVVKKFSTPTLTVCHAHSNAITLKSFYR